MDEERVEPMCAPLPLGGYDYQFVEPPPKQWECPICLLTLRAPHLLSCCGVKICQSCIDGVKNKGRPCPKCRKSEFVTLLDKELERLIFDLVLHCPLSVSGCNWTGELRHLDKHTSPLQGGDCRYVEVECSHGCGQKMTRDNMAAHEKESCPKLPLEIQIRVLQERMERMSMEMNKRHEAEVTALKVKVAEQEQEILELKKNVQDLMQTRKESFSTSIPVFTPSILLLMPKLPCGNIPGVHYYPSDQYVKISGNSKEEMEARTQQFLTEFERILPLLQKDKFEILPRFPIPLVESVVSTCNRNFRACYAISYQSNVELISTNTSEHQQAKKILAEKLSQKIQVLQFSGPIECTLTLKVCSIFDEMVDLVIVPAESSPGSSGLLSLTSSKVSKDTAPIGVMVPNSQGKYKSKNIIYVPNYSASTNMGDQFDSIQNALSEAASHKANKSVAIPGDSTGKAAFKSSFVIPAVIQSIKKLLDKKRCDETSTWRLSDVRIAIQDVADDGWFYSFVNYLAAKYDFK